MQYMYVVCVCVNCVGVRAYFTHDWFQLFSYAQKTNDIARHSHSRIAIVDSYNGSGSGVDGDGKYETEIMRITPNKQMIIMMMST